MKLYDPIFMHDDASLHSESKELLDESFQQWIGPGSSYATWPRLSPDIHPLCFFLWGFIKSKVFEKPIGKDDDTELSIRIHHAFTEIIPEMLDHAVRAYKDRLKIVLDHHGSLVDVHDDYEDVPADNDIHSFKWMAD